MNIRFAFTAEVWQHAGTGSWHFVSMPEEMVREIREHSAWLQEGWGRIKVRAEIGSFAWDTAIWYDTKKQTYLLPLKAEIRKRLGIEVGMKRSVILLL
jgi:hypothetical protein